MLISLNRNPNVRQLKQFGFVALGVFGVIGAFLWWRGSLFGMSLGDDAYTIAYGLWFVGIVSSIASIVYPKANRPLFVVLTMLSFPIGWLFSHLVISFLYFAVITPIAFIFRVIGRDPLTRRFSPERESYWENSPKAGELRDYFRQF